MACWLCFALSVFTHWHSLYIHSSYFLVILEWLLNLNTHQWVINFMMWWCSAERAGERFSHHHHLFEWPSMSEAQWRCRTATFCWLEEITGTSELSPVMYSEWHRLMLPWCGPYMYWGIKWAFWLNVCNSGQKYLKISAKQKQHHWYIAKRKFNLFHSYVN